MALPFPKESQAGATSASAVAQAIYAHLAWIARWSDELASEPDVDLKKLAQLGFGPNSHCAQFLALTASPTADVVAAVVDRFAREGLTITGGQVTEVRAAAQALVDAATVVPELAVETRVFLQSGGERADPIKAAKPHPTDSFVAALRAAFD
jgi:hypothetical protein